MNQAQTFFFKLSTILIVIFLFLLFMDPYGDQLNVFFLKTNDFMADFFNVMRYIADNDPYFNDINGPGEHCYLPIAYLILKPFCLFFDFSKASLFQCYQSKNAIAACITFSFLSIAIYAHSFNLLLKSTSKIMFFPFLFSSIFLFTIERGNLILITAASIIYFIIYKDSHNPKFRIFAYTCLCIAASLKIYPFIFGIYLLKEKKYKVILFCIVLTLCLVFLPFVFFDHSFSNIPKLLSNTNVYSESYSATHLFPRFGLAPSIYPLLKILNFNNFTISTTLIGCRILTYVLAILSAFLFFVTKSEWKALALISITLVMLPSNSALYCGLYLFPFILLFLSRDFSQKKDYIYIFSFCIYLSPIQFVIHHPFLISVTPYIANAIIFILWIYVILEETIVYLSSKHTRLHQNS